ncbi:hypothetical protein ACL9RI_26930 [Janthinobacterium sp. Mn2066]|uniref:hypothetical protein n=1 Tax=Janthinobacterium sp. Mn2066 TaxID=3395264 RepID=UPI003BE3108C
MDWILLNKEWLFSGIGIFFLGWLGKFFIEKNKPSESTPPTPLVTINNTLPMQVNSAPTIIAETSMSLPDRKQKTKILFIDDDTKFKVAKILIKSGWLNTSIIKDANTLDEPAILDAHILFVDVQGVGVALGFADEGLGLALALIEKYPKKKIIIYSSETKGDRFHAALRKADSSLPKNADPYEFQKLVEELSSDFNLGK